MLTQKVLRIWCAMCAAENREQEAAEGEARAALELGPGSVGRPIGCQNKWYFFFDPKEEGKRSGCLEVATHVVFCFKMN